MRHVLKTIAAAAALAAAAIPAHASLILAGDDDFDGTGLGSVNTVLTINSPGNSSFASGSVGFGGSITGDALSGNSQTNAFTLGQLGISSAQSLRVVFNAQEPGNEAANGITLADLQLSIFSPTGDLLFSSGVFSSVDFAETNTGTGNAGFVFRLDDDQAAAAAATAFSGSFADNVVGLSAAVGCGDDAGEGCLGATGGLETFFVAEGPGGENGGGGNGGPVAPIPEPQTYALMLAGLSMVAWLGRRRSRRD